MRGVSQFRCYLRELDRAIDRTDRWLSAVERQSRDLTAEFGDKLGLVAKLDEVLTEDQRTLDAVRDELGKVNEMTPAISDLQRRIGQAAGTVSGMRDQLQQIAKARGVENLLEWARGSASDLLAKASCVSTAHRLGASTRSCGTRLSVDSAEQILDAARHRDFPALTQWVVTAQTPLVPGGSIPPTEEDYDRARARIDRTQGPPPLNTSSRPAANASGGSSSGSPPAPPLPSPKPARATAPPLPGDSSEQRSLNLDAAAVEAQIRDATGI